MLAGMAYHVVHLVRVPRDRVILRHLVPRVQDLRDLGAALRHSLGRGEAPRFGMFSYAEKAEYLAFVWGALLMAATGFVLWFDNWTLRNFPTWVMDAATALHWYEAILATGAILIWHFYMVIFDPDVYPMDKAWITGRTSADHVQANRPEYYRSIVEAQARAQTPAPSEDPPSGEDS
jgi:cytochrome b subunit of formate dehydrogenase